MLPIVEEEEMELELYNTVFDEDDYDIDFEEERELLACSARVNR